MSDYISRERALQFPLANGQYDHENANEHFINGCESYKEWLEQIPAADVKPVVRGHYIGDYDGYADGNPVYDIWSCSVCGCVFENWDEEPTYKFCHNCGADMRPKDE